MTKDRTVRSKQAMRMPEPGESRLDQAIRQMVEVETGQRARPAGGSVEIVDEPDIGGIRRSLGLTQQEMAETIGMPIGTLRNWEQGRRKPSNAGKLVLRLLAEAPRTLAASAARPSSTGDDPKVIGRAQLARAVAETARLTADEARIAVEAVLDEIASALAHGAAVKLKGFGSFSVSHRGATLARNPRTGDAVEVQARNVPKFVAGKDLKDAIN